MHFFKTITACHSAIFFSQQNTVDLVLYFSALSHTTTGALPLTSYPKLATIAPTQASHLNDASGDELL